MYKRIIDIKGSLESHSILLLGPRQTGKSTLLKSELPKARYFDLLKANIFRELSARPELLGQSLNREDRIVVIDEIQKLPVLLDEVQSLMLERPELRFVLTGSSARKLKRGGANLLAGRALVFNLHPLVTAEVGYERIDDLLSRGGLPPFLNGARYRQALDSYVGTYLREEIQAEGAVRGIEGFSRFLEVAALTNSEQINFTSVANDAGVTPRIVREYYQILEDTLVGFQLPAYQKTTKRKPVATAKFYFFDLGVTASLLNRFEMSRPSEVYGKALEQLVCLELRAYLSYKRWTSSSSYGLSDSSSYGLYYWRSTSQLEVDFVIGDEIAIEVKAKERVSTRDIKGMLAIAEEVPLRRKLVVCHTPLRHSDGSGVEHIPVAEFFQDLWSGKII